MGFFVVKELDLRGVKKDQIENKIVAFIEDNLNSGKNLEIITDTKEEKAAVADVVDKCRSKYDMALVSSKDINRTVIWT
jgi:late competence protein required for DNA uptake (superfamily II DNA/RNA helicase)